MNGTTERYPSCAMMPTEADAEMKAAATACIGREGPWLVVWSAMAEVVVKRLAASPPPGFKLVPIEPTEEMIQAVWKATLGGSLLSAERAARAMLAACPEPAIAASPTTPSASGAGDEPPDEDWLTDVIDDSLDMDWTGRVGARAIIAAWDKRHD